MKWHQRDVKWLESEREKAKSNGERVVVMTHHAPIRYACGDPTYDERPSNAAFSTDMTYADKQ